MDTIVRRALSGAGIEGGGPRYGADVYAPGAALVGLSPAIEPPMGREPWNPLQNVGAQYSADPTVPDPLPPLVNYSHDMPDTDERVAHNYPGEPVEWRNRGVPMTPLQQAFSTRGYGDMPGQGGGFGPADVTNAVTLPKGLLPMFGRANPAPLTIDPLDGTSFKPPKTTVAQIDLHESPAAGWNVFGNRWNGTQQMAYVEPYTKWRSGVGAYNDAWPSQIDENGRVRCCDGAAGGDGTLQTQQYGFDSGEQLVARTGGEHYGLKRIWREVPSKRKVLYFNIRNPSTAVGRFGSEWAQGTGPLGELDVPYNARVKEYYREPMPTAGLTADRVGAHETVVLPFQNRTGCPPGSVTYERRDDGTFQEVVSDGQAFREAAGGGDPRGARSPYGETSHAWFGAKNSMMHANEAMRPTNEQRDVIPNKTTQFPLGSGFAVASAQLKGPADANPIRLRPTHRICYTGDRNAISDPAPAYASGGPAVYNTEFVIDPHNIKEIGAGYRVVCGPGAAAGCANQSPQESCLVAGTDRPGGPGLALGSTADRWATARVNPAQARHCLKEQLVDDCAVRPPMSDAQYQSPQRGDIPAPENRKVTPFIQNEIDASLLQALRQNPYAQPIACDA